MPKKKPTKRRTMIGTDAMDAMDAVVPVRAASKASRRGLVPAGTTHRPEPPAKPKPNKVRATFHLPEELLGEARDAVVYLSGPPVRLTLAVMAENALRKELQRLKKAHNGGKGFPRHGGELKGGRPIGS